MLNYIQFYDIIVSTSGLLHLLGIIISFICVMYISYREKIDIYNSIIIFLITILFFFFGAKILNIIETKNSYVDISNGFTYTGGLLFGLFSLFINSKIFKYKFCELCGRFLIIFPIIYSTSKIGCFINNCCSGTLIIPIQFIESFLGLMLSILIFIMKINNIQNVKIIYIYFIIFGSFKFILDFFRINPSIFIFNLSLSQLICIFFLLIGILMYNLSKKIFKKEECYYGKKQKNF